ncbi:class I SAM-dependent methyltransferase [Halorussus amylolyticus]|uniref:class I SAM-dependent methyltransferase n=1 Tax=Halorussus amylolyticus TaxID=1126242 RepID=UPI001EE49AB9|nr:class I SAM-dependent methyltransferase [Halorussus amylolyticus]
MVETTTETFDVAGAVADAERLPFDSGAFDAATCRIAAHHFPDPRAFVREVARVLEPGGTFAFEDCIAPEDDDLAAFLNRFERTRDPSHVEMFAESEWNAWLRDAGFEIGESVTMAREMDYTAWVDRTDPGDERREMLAELVRTPEAAELYGVTFEDDDVATFSNRKLLVRAVLRE